jgi:peptidyl-prolyl cis-trans isomerase B (cyclophilin B)
MTITPATKTSTMSNSPLNTMALVGFILSLSGVATGITLIPGIVLSHIGMSQIKRTGESGRGFALAGLIVGYCLLGLSVLAIIVVVILAVIFPLLFVNALSSMRYSAS